MRHRTIQRRILGIRWLAAGAALVLLAGSALPAAGANRYPPDRINGTIQVHGCAPGPRDLTLRAQSLTSGVVTDPEAFRAERPNPRNGRTAVLRATDDPHVLSFMIHGLQPGQVYRLAIRDEATAKVGACRPCSTSRSAGRTSSRESRSRSRPIGAAT